MDVRYWHGGIPGLRPGDLIVPSEPNYLDNCPVCQAKKAGINTPMDPLTGHPDSVYITTDRDYGRFYASKYPRGDLYRVEPVGDLVASDEDRFPTWRARSVRVAAVLDRCVTLTHRQRTSLIHRWEVLDRAAVRGRSRMVLVPPAVD